MKVSDAYIVLIIDAYKGRQKQSLVYKCYKSDADNNVFLSRLSSSGIILSLDILVEPTEGHLVRQR